MASQGGHNVLMRDYRKGNWTLQETMVLIEAKKMDDERRMKRQGDSSSERSGKPAELRWKWVEDYCWRNNCLRSQNQCNDKWDNLIRDFKKVREYERRLAEQHDGSERDEKSYWKLEKNERKAKNLPSNMLSQIYQALVEVVERKGQRGMVGFVGVGTSGTASTSKPKLSSSSAAQPLPLPPSQHHPISTPVPPLPLPPAPAVAQTPALEHPSHPFPQQLPTVGTLPSFLQSYLSLSITLSCPAQCNMIFLCD